MPLVERKTQKDAGKVKCFGQSLPFLHILYGQGVTFPFTALDYCAHWEWAHSEKEGKTKACKYLECDKITPDGRLRSKKSSSRGNDDESIQ